MTNGQLLELLGEAQTFVSERCVKLLNAEGGDQRERIRHAIEGFVEQKGIQESEKRKTVNFLYDEMAAYSVLTPYLTREDVEEIDVNSWKDIMIQYSDGRREKLEQGFLSKTIATDIVKRLLRTSGTVMDNVDPLAEGTLPGEKRIAAIQSPILDEDTGVSCSIRLLHPTNRTLEDLIQNGTGSKEMMEFLERCFYGKVSFVVAGSTDAGKTTLLGALLRKVPVNMRIFAIESGTREFSLIREENGRISTNVVHTLSTVERSGNISQEKLVEAALRFNPDIIVVGEMRDVEAFSAVEAAGSGHMVVSTVHASCARGAITRIAMLSKKKYQMDFQTAYQQAAMAFPVVVTVKKDNKNKRRIINVSEVELTNEGEVLYHTLFGWEGDGFVLGEAPSTAIRRVLYDE